VNYAKIWVRDAALPSCSHEDLDDNSTNNASSHFLRATNSSNSFATSFRMSANSSGSFSSLMSKSPNNNMHKKMSSSNSFVFRSPPHAAHSMKNVFHQESGGAGGSGGVGGGGENEPHKSFKRNVSSRRSMKEANGSSGMPHHHHHHPDWDNKIMPLLSIGLKRLVHSQWPIVPLVQPAKKRPSFIKNVLDNTKETTGNSLDKDGGGDGGEKKKDKGISSGSNDEQKEEKSNETKQEGKEEVSFVVGAKLRSKFEHVRLGYETLNVDSALGDDHYIEHRRKRISNAIRKGLPKSLTFSCSISLGAGMEVYDIIIITYSPLHLHLSLSFERCCC
jgi:hypothetical protein